MTIRERRRAHALRWKAHSAASRAARDAVAVSRSPSDIPARDGYRAAYRRHAATVLGLASAQQPDEPTRESPSVPAPG